MRTLYHINFSITSYLHPFDFSSYRTAGGHMAYNIQCLWFHISIQDYVRYDASKDQITQWRG